MSPPGDIPRQPAAGRAAPAPGVGRGVSQVLLSLASRHFSPHPFSQQLTCHPPNPTGLFRATRSVFFFWGGWGKSVLTVVDAPQEPSFISLVEPRGGRQAVLLCTVDSFPPSDIALHRGPGHGPLASTWGSADPRVTVQVAPNSLRVEMGGLELRDAGLYVCSANNSYGTASSSLRLDVGGEGSPEPWSQ